MSLQMHIKSLPWRRKRANTTKNMQKINSLVRSGLATSFSFRHLALLWEALIIFYCFTHSQKYDETRTECGFFFLSSYSKHHELFTHETQLHFLLKRSFLLSSGSQTSDPPWAGNGPQGFSTHHSTNTWGHHHWLSPSIPTVPWTQPCPRWDQTSLGGVGVGAEMGHKRVLGQFPAVGSPSWHPCTPSPSSGSF